VRLENTRRVIEEMRGSAVVRHNMGQYGEARILHTWAKKIEAAVVADEKEIERWTSRESTPKSSSSSDTSTS
jgi:hypothetical protein